jgi:hypothetical protein
MASALLKLGIARLQDAAGRDPNEMCHEPCGGIDTKRHDPCVRDVLAAVVSHAEGGPARPWPPLPLRQRTRPAYQNLRGQQRQRVLYPVRAVHERGLAVEPAKLGEVSHGSSRTLVIEFLSVREGKQIAGWCLDLQDQINPLPQSICEAPATSALDPVVE